MCIQHLPRTTDSCWGWGWGWGGSALRLELWMLDENAPFPEDPDSYRLREFVFDSEGGVSYARPAPVAAAAADLDFSTLSSTAATPPLTQSGGELAATAAEVVYLGNLADSTCHRLSGGL